MRKFIVFLLTFLLIFSLATTVFAASAPSLSSTTTMASDGSCQVSLGLTLRLDSTDTKLSLPLPQNADKITVNGDEAITYKENGLRYVDLQYTIANMVGDVTLNIRYELYGLVNENKLGILELQLPLLSGFEYEISNLQFSVTLPGVIESQPAFTSGYHQAGIEEFLSYSINGDTLHGNSLKAIKDHETLVMTLPVSEEMFPRVVAEAQSTLTAHIGMAACAGLALLFWLLFLRFFPKVQRCSEPPVGISAGQVGCIVGNGGMDLTMTVFSWAQSGYVLIHPSKKGRVMLHKRMEMGNERCEQERYAFERLFGSRYTIDATGPRYAALASALSGRRADVDELFHKFSGNPLFLRLLCMGIGIFGGSGIGAVLGNGSASYRFLTVSLGILGGLTGWTIPTWTDGGIFRRKSKAATGGVLALGWLVLAFSGGCGLLGFVMVAELLIFGILYGCSGLRTAPGKQTAAQLLGLRRYLKGKELEQLDHACDNDPDYFFRMFPYAVALGVGPAFAKAVCYEELERCPYMVYEPTEKMDSLSWYRLMARTVDSMDTRKRARLIDGFLSSFRGIHR